MTKYLIFALLVLVPAARAAEDCSDTGACAPGARLSSPFAAASAGEPPAPPAAAKKAALRQAPAAAAPAAPAVPPARENPVPAPAGKPAPDRLSSPLWLFFVVGALAVLYLYLKGGRRRSGRR